MIHITTATTTTLPVCHGIRLEINAPIASGTITVNDGANAVAIIVNPASMGGKEFYGFSGVPTIVTSSTCDLTVSIYQNLK